MDSVHSFRRARRRLIGLAVLVLAVTSMWMGSLSLALFTDQESVAAAFSSGTVALDDVKIDSLTLTTSGLVPGDTVTDAVEVENDGSVDLRYALSTATTDPDGKALRDVLVLTIKAADVTTPGVPCDDFDGPTLAAATAFGASGAGFGDASQGADPGDRTLAGGANEVLCVRVALPLATGDAYQAATATTTFTFDAEQTANNP
jgi:hypothetical protein